MKRINLTKYGCTRDQSQDFTDDGTRFTVYYIGTIRITKASDREYTYIHGSSTRNELTYDEYSKLPHYSDLDMLNGVCTTRISEAEIIKFINSCMTYESEYEQAVANLKFPVEDEVKPILDIQAKEAAEASKEFDSLSPAICKAFANKSGYELERLSNYCRYFYSAVDRAVSGPKNIASYANSRQGQILINEYNKIKPEYIVWLEEVKKLIF